MTCGLCGYKFWLAEHPGCSGCPVNRHCAVICCPNCGYHFVAESQTLNWLKKVFGSKKVKAVAK